MNYIQDDLFLAIMKVATPIKGNGWDLEERVYRSYPYQELRYWNGGAAKSGDYREVAYLKDTLTEEYILKVKLCYHGEQFPDREPEFYALSKADYEALRAQFYGEVNPHKKKYLWGIHKYTHDNYERFAPDISERHAEEEARVPLNRGE